MIAVMLLCFCVTWVGMALMYIEITDHIWSARNERSRWSNDFGD